MVTRDKNLEKRFGEYLKAVRPSNAELGEHFGPTGQPFTGNGSSEEDLIEAIYRATTSDRDMDEEIHDVIADPGMYADMAWEVMKYLRLRGVHLA